MNDINELLEKELENILEKENAFVTDDREVKYYNGDSFNHIYELEFIAKHFFELGLNKAKGKYYDDMKGYIDIEEQNSWEVVGKNKPKFHRGEWITNGEYIWQIDEVKTENYLLIDSECNLFAEEIAKIDSEFHLLT